MLSQQFYQTADKFVGIGMLMYIDTAVFRNTKAEAVFFCRNRDISQLFCERIREYREPCKHFSFGIMRFKKMIQGSSGHADKDGLLCWINAFDRKPKKVFVVHGEDSVCDEFTECLKEEYGYDAMAPYTGGSYDLIADRVISEGVKERKTRRTTSTQRGKTVFDRLVAAGKRLMTVITHNEGGTNKDLAKFTDQINALCDKWDR